MSQNYLDELSAPPIKEQICGLVLKAESVGGQNFAAMLRMCCHFMTSVRRPSKQTSFNLKVSELVGEKLKRDDEDFIDVTLPHDNVAEKHRVEQ